ncbi:hypothetical protein [Noviherbaspirillum sedimenti]|uniref:Thioredoxin domain-containing protein n=1 Tax=Noviherbaspirillum sedimenti TaxID=2320865 RepID=A0A3A3GDL9_9BURK|nr:hypothetical protein [Noviherbaspirillum sedimenti]RJG00326.1 hypothetical protein D3878_01000 [Noviherbaspirillum sedimenti]
MKNRLAAGLLLLTLLFNAMGVQAEEKIHAFASESFERILADHAGKPFMIMVWSLDCVYCEASFKALAAAGRPARFQIVTIAADRADDPEARRLIREKLKRAGLKAELWAFGAAPAEQLHYAIDPQWRGEMPRSYWFNARGERVAYSGIITANTIARLTAAW